MVIVWQLVRHLSCVSPECLMGKGLCTRDMHGAIWQLSSQEAELQNL